LNISELLETVKKGNILAAESAAEELAKGHSPQLIPALIETYAWLDENPKKRDISCGRRQAVVRALGELGSPQSADVLRQAIRTVQITKLGPSTEDAATGLRAQAALSLAQSDPDCLYELSLLLFDVKPNVHTSPAMYMYAKSATRAAAAQALGSLGDSGGAAILAVKLAYPGDEVTEVLSECIDSAALLNPPYLLEITEPYLLGENANLAAVTALALAANMKEAALDVLITRLERIHADALAETVVAISSIRSGRTKHELEKLAEHANGAIRAAAKEGLGLFQV
jgi:HEAT repeat protein